MRIEEEDVGMSWRFVVLSFAYLGVGMFRIACLILQHTMSKFNHKSRI